MKDNHTQEPTILEKLVDEVAIYWKDNRYYQDAESWMNRFWSNQGEFYPLFEKLNLTNVVELACGHGRHAEKLKEYPNCRKKILVDVNQENIDFCRQRFQDDDSYKFIKSNGYNFYPIETETCTSIYSYDAIVHFESEVIFSYLVDSFRILKPGGQALFHHSNYTGNPGGFWRDNPGGRNYMSQSLFFHYAKKVGFKVIESKIFSWQCKIPNTDCLTLIVKPRPQKVE